MVKIADNFNNNNNKDKVNEILEDYKFRQVARRTYDEAWLLNINFLLGNQNTYISSTGEIKEEDKVFPYESKEVFNHIAPIVESRLAKLGKVRPVVAVRPSSTSEKDKETAKLSKMVLDSEFDRMGISSLIKEASVWSEVTGTSIYKLTYTGDDENLGFEISVVSPFEIFPENASLSDIDDNPSIIHAKCVDRQTAESVYGVSGLRGEDMRSLSLDSLIGSGNGFFSGGLKASRTAEEIKHDQVLVVERYTKPSKDLPAGKLEIVVGDQLFFEGNLPLGEYPFVKQVSNICLGSFWGTSVIERCIPVQRAYNAVKNRKLEFLSRLSSGVLAVEEGSVDLDSLEDEGLAPGKILVYRSGTASPRFMDGFSIPPELNREEDRLLNELNTLAGVSDLMRSSLLPSNVTSGAAINYLTEADDTRLSVTAEHIRESLLRLSKLALRSIKRMAGEKQISKLFDDKGNVQVFYWSASDLKSDDVVLDTVNELSDSVSSRRSLAMDMFKAGLFSDAEGKLDKRAKSKILEILGFGNFESGQDITDLHMARAKKENLCREKMMVLEVDDHDVHILEHTRYLIENCDLDENRLNQVVEHIRTHKSFKAV